MKIRKTYSVVFASLVILGFPAMAVAASPISVVDVDAKVSHEDLNISSEAGAKVLYQRLQRASERVCDVRTFKELGSVARYVDAQACLSDTLSAAVRKIDSKPLSKIHSG